MLPIRIGLGRKRRNNNRTHQFSSGANFDWAIKLYYFDFDLRNILLRYISRIEVNFRTSVFANYINTVRKLRNNCAHEKVLFDMTLPQAIGDGPCGNLGNRRTMLFGAYKVFKYLLGRISENRVKEMQAELVDAFDRVSYSTVKNVIFNNSGFRMNEI